MTLLHLDSCAIPPKYTYNVEHVTFVSQNTAQSRTGPYTIRSYTGYDFRYYTTISEGVIGLAVYFGTLATIENVLLTCTSYLNAKHLRVVIMPDGSITMERGTTVLQRSTKTIRVDCWQYIEFKWSISNSIAADSCILKINGVEYINLTAGTDTQNATAIDMGYIEINGFVNYTYFTDIYVCDLNGSINNDFLGSISIEALAPNGNGNTNDFVGSDSNSTDNYLHVDEAVVDEDTSYVESKTVGDIDLYTYGNLSGTPVSIVGLVVRPIAKKILGGNRIGEIITRINGTNYSGDMIYSGIEYKTAASIWELNPDDAAAWEAADINGAEFGIEVAE